MPKTKHLTGKKDCCLPSDGLYSFFFLSSRRFSHSWPHVQTPTHLHTHIVNRVIAERPGFLKEWFPQSAGSFSRDLSVWWLAGGWRRLRRRRRCWRRVGWVKGCFESRQRRVGTVVLMTVDCTKHIVLPMSAHERFTTSPCPASNRSKVFVWNQLYSKNLSILLKCTKPPLARQFSLSKMTINLICNWSLDKFERPKRGETFNANTKKKSTLSKQYVQLRRRLSLLFLSSRQQWPRVHTHARVCLQGFYGCNSHTLSSLTWYLVTTINIWVNVLKHNQHDPHKELLSLSRSVLMCFFNISKSCAVNGKQRYSCRIEVHHSACFSKLPVRIGQPCLRWNASRNNCSSQKTSV